MAEWVDRLLPGLPPAPSKIDPKTGMNLQMRGIARRNGDVAFDSYLILHNGSQNHTLSLVLKVYLRQLLDQSMPRVWRVPIFDGNQLFLMKPWRTAEWADFVRKFKRECAKWTNHFWLIPPAGFSTLDVKVGKHTIRPNIYCHLEVVVVPGPGGAHRTIDVVNLDKEDAKARLGIEANDLDGGTFRSNAVRYASLDVKLKKDDWMQDDHGVWYPVNNYSTIVHEIGHALGLPHIGVTHQDPRCQMAVLADQISPKLASLPALFKGGSNASVCYGTLWLPQRGENVMGGGTKFEESNGAPWVKRITQHTFTRAQDWTVSTTKVAPKWV
jgi:hypothetical protein